MPNRLTASPCFLLSLAILLGSSANGQDGWSPRPLGGLGGLFARAEAVDAAGEVVVGFAQDANFNDMAFRWTSGSGLQPLGTLGGFWSRAHAVSADGLVIVGSSMPTQGTTGSPVSDHAFRWTSASGLVDLQPPTWSSSIAYDVSDDGLVVVGYCDDASQVREAFRWDSANGMQRLGTLAGDVDSTARGVDAFGDLLVGESRGTTATRPFRWTQAAGMQPLPLVPGTANGRANDVSFDGRVAVGECWNQLSSPVACRWDLIAGTVEELIPSAVESRAASISRDGTKIVGQVYSLGADLPYILHESGELELIRPFSGGDADLAGINDDGTVVVGAEENFSGRDQAIVWRTRSLHALFIGIDDERLRPFDGAKSARRVHAVVDASGRFDSTTLVERTFSQDGALTGLNTRDIIAQQVTDLISNGTVNPGDLLLFWISTHGAQELDPPGQTVPDDEALVVHRTNPLTLDTAVSDTDEVLILDDSSFVVTDDWLRSLFLGPGWGTVDKLFVIDSCFSGGFWGETTWGDTGDFATLDRAALLAASDESTFSYSTAAPGLDNGMSYLALAVEAVLPSLLAGGGFSFDDLVRAVEAQAEHMPYLEPYQNSTGDFIGWICGTNDYSAFYGVDVPAELDVRSFSTPDFFGSFGRCSQGGATCFPLGTTFCGPASSNSTGVPAEIDMTGSTLIVDGTATLQVIQVPPGALGYFIASRDAGFVAPPGSQGIVCLGGSIGRFRAPHQIQQGPTGSLLLDLTNMPVTGAAVVQPGDSWLFQFWYRDANPGSTSNFTAGLSVTFE